MSRIYVDKINRVLKNKPLPEVIKFIYDEFDSKVALASSLGAEDQVLTDVIVKNAKELKIFTLDTGRLNPETLDTLDKTELKYSKRITVFYPKSELVEDFVNTHGINSFYESVAKRKACCYARKIEPLQRALKPLDAWITGLRREQSVTREEMQLAEWDEANNLIKFNPLIDWSEQDVWDYIKKENVPYNKLHDLGYPSIGCAPCTRAIKDGEDIRAGRWWWENPEHKECGLHKR